MQKERSGITAERQGPSLRAYGATLMDQVKRAGWVEESESHPATPTKSTRSVSDAAGRDSPRNQHSGNAAEGKESRGKLFRTHLTLKRFPTRVSMRAVVMSPLLRAAIV